MSANMLKEICLTNFKAFGPKQVIPLKPITLIYGPNSAGKSSILDAVSWIRSLVLRKGLDQWTNYVHLKDSDKIMAISYKVGLQEHWPFEVAFEHAFPLIHEPRIRALKELCVNFSIGVPRLISQPDKIRFPPKILDFDASFDGIHFVSANLVTICPDRTTHNHAFSSFLDLSDFNKQNPASLGIAEYVINSAIEQLKDVIDLPRTPLYSSSDHISCAAEATRSLEVIRHIDAPRLIKHIDLDSGSIRFDADNFTPLPKYHVVRIFEQILSHNKDGLISTSITTRFLRTESDMLNYLEDQFWQTLSTFVGLLFDPFNINLGTGFEDGICRIPPIRSRPDSGLRLNNAEDIEKLAPDWNYFSIYPEHIVSHIDRVNRWLKDRSRSDTCYEIKAVPFSQVERDQNDSSSKKDVCYGGILDLKRNISVELSEMGAGFSQLLPVLLASFGYEKICLIEQPELHLHPALAAEIADLFILQGARGNETGEETRTMNQFIIETHSEHILLRLMRRIRESTANKLPPGLPPLTPDDVGVLYVDNVGDHSVVREMLLNKNGELIHDWPGGFFEEGLREVLI